MPAHDIHSTLRQYWGYDNFRPLQADIIRSVLDGHDTLGLLPTGGGKSITFQVPAMMLPGITVVITPLVSLMKDQVDNLRARDIRAYCLYSGMTRREQNLALARCLHLDAHLLYIAPERLGSRSFVDELRRLQVSLIVVDEAHCISQWGYDFRPAYLNIAALRDIHPDAPVLALTASATPAVAADIRRLLRFGPDAREFARSFDRENLSYIVRHTDNKLLALERILRNVGGTSIVYVRSRRRTREVAEALRSIGISADFYHAGLDPEEKAQRQDSWKEGSTRVMVATNAFGMGIDKPDVRSVVHIDLPSSLEEYYQEAGRAGRDGLHAWAVLLVDRGDGRSLSRRLADAFPPKDYIRHIYERAMVQIGMAVGEGYDTMHTFDFNLFCFNNRLQPVPARSALMILSRAGHIEYIEEPSVDARVMMLQDRHKLYDLDLSPTNDTVLQSVLRTCAGVFADYVRINEVAAARSVGLDTETYYRSLLTLTRMHVLHYIPRRHQPALYMPMPRQDTRYIAIPDTVYTQRRDIMEQRIEAMRRFAFATDISQCRDNMLLEYFGQPPIEGGCGRCDLCRERARLAQPPADDSADIASRMLRVIRAAGTSGITTEQLLAEFAPLSPERFRAIIRPHLASGALTLTPDSRLILTE